MTAEHTATLTVEELSGIFKALGENNPEYTLDTALDETIVLAKRKGLGAVELGAVLEGVGIEITDTFRQWLEQKF